tara:strand:- start:904 stop:1920 length:1017 start_codon:yes stop_codon:yes gene_type:complete
MFISGLSKTGGAGADDFAFGTDLGIQTNFQANSTEVAKVPAKGSVATFNTLVAGTGYTIGKGIQLVEDPSSAAGGTGFTAIATVIDSGGVLRLGSVGKFTASFNSFQNTLLDNFDPFDLDPYTWARTTGSGQPMPDTVTGPVTTTAITSTGGSGTGATFFVTVNGGMAVSATVAAIGTGYKVGDTVTLTIANLQAAMQVANDNQATFIQSDITMILTEENVTGAIQSLTILNGGQGYRIGDTITLSEAGSPIVGTGSVDALTLGTASTVITAPNNRYPRGIKTSTGTQAAPKTIEFVGMNDVNVIIGGFTAGTVLPFQFKQVIDAGTDAVLGNITILY